MENITIPKVEILWTGGFDSSFRVVELSKYDITIQPFYLSDNRKSENYELNAIKEITELLQQNPKTHAEILQPIIINSSDRIEDPEVTEAYNRVLKNDYFGSQYDWLGRFAKSHQGLELSIHEDDKATGVIKKHGAFKKIDDPITGGTTYILDVEHSERDIITLFSNYHLPLVNMTKLQMKEQYIAGGYKEVMNKTWFCYSPINGQPCGICNPCRYTIEEGMSERFSKSALVRYRLYPLMNNSLIRKLKSLYKRLLKTIQKGKIT